MVEGVTIDNTYGSRGISSWLEGPLKTSIWVGVLLNGKKPIAISTMRCSACGFLESYAKP